MRKTSQTLVTTYLYNIDGTTIEFDCTVFLLEDQSIDFAHCTDTEGNTVEQESNFICELSLKCDAVLDSYRFTSITGARVAPSTGKAGWSLPLRGPVGLAGKGKA